VRHGQRLRSGAATAPVRTRDAQAFSGHRGIRHRVVFGGVHVG